MKARTLLIFSSVLGAVLLAAVASWAEKTEISTYYPYPTTSAAQVRSDNGAIGDAAFRVNTPPTNGLIVQGNVGIGTPTPQGVLDVRQAVDGNLGIFLANNQLPTAGSLNETVTLQFLHGHPSGGNALKTGGHIRSGKESDYTSDANVDSYLAFATALNDADVERMRITSAGNVGIGTTSPRTYAKLHVNTPSSTTNLLDGILVTANLSAGTRQPVTLLEATFTTGGNEQAADTAISAQTNSGVSLNAHSNSGRAVQAGSVSGHALWVQSGKSYFAGDVGIGTTTPTLAKLQVVSSTLTAVRGEGSGSTSYGGQFVGGLAGISADGPTGVSAKSTATNGPAVSGVATGTGGVGVSGYANGADSVGVRGNGAKWDLEAAGGSSRLSWLSSSIRWKKNVQPLEGTLQKVLKLQGVSFDWDAEHGGQHSIGMIAEEVGKVFPEFVGYEEKSKDAITLDYGKLTAVLVEAVKELKAENEAMKARIEAQQKELGALKAGLKQENQS